MGEFSFLSRTIRITLNNHGTIIIAVTQRRVSVANDLSITSSWLRGCREGKFFLSERFQYEWRSFVRSLNPA